MSTKPTLRRRRFLGIAGFASAAALTHCSRPVRERDAAPAWHWEGILFGAEASVVLHGVDAAQGEQLTRACFSRMRELESLFSLYQPDSAVCRLNRDGFLKDPPDGFRELLEHALQVSRRTNGIFDITVQPLWELYAQHYRHERATGIPSKELLELALAKVDYRAIESSEDRVSFAQAGMAVTFNGIAQGYITDQVSDFLRREGMTQTLVHMGEYRALGAHPEKRPWNLGIRLPGSPDAILDEVALEDRALAVSGGYGHVFDVEGLHHHLFHPRTAGHLPAKRSVCVTAPRATDADAYATASAVIDESTARAWLAGTDIELAVYQT